ncbi:hypothetical protein Hanom_Chr12g01118111 [Helianthus anomalus]
MYYGNCGGSSTAAKPAPHAPLQTTFVTSTDLYGNPIQIVAQPQRTTNFYGNPIQPVQPVPQQQSYRLPEQQICMEIHYMFNSKPVMEAHHLLANHLQFR